MRGLLVAAALLLSACTALWMPSDEEVYACAAGYTSESGVPRPAISSEEWDARKAACAACMIRGGTSAGCAGTYP